MARTTVLSTPRDPTLKKQAEERDTSLGLSLPDAINVFLRKDLQVGGLPFELR